MKKEKVLRLEAETFGGRRRRRRPSGPSFFLSQKRAKQRETSMKIGKRVFKEEENEKVGWRSTWRVH